jgi:hypothetical protein
MVYRAIFGVITVICLRYVIVSFPKLFQLPGVSDMNAIIGRHKGAKLNIKTAFDILMDPSKVKLYDPDCKEETRVATIGENFCLLCSTDSCGRACSIVFVLDHLSRARPLSLSSSSSSSV